MVLSLLFTVGFTGLTALTVTIWVVDPRTAATNPVVDLGFFALGAVIIGGGFASQIRSPQRSIAGLQQAVIGLLCLTMAGVIGGRVEPTVGGLAFLLATAPLVALHPARRDLFAPGARVSVPLAALTALAAVPATGYAVRMLGLARRAGASCFLGRCATGDRYAEMAALALAVVLVGLLATVRTRGWQIPTSSAAAAAVILGATSLALPDLTGALQQPWAAMTVLWGLSFIAVARRRSPPWLSRT